MASVTLKGNTVNTKGDIPQEGSKAADFTFVGEDLSEGKLSDYAGKVRVVISVPSLDTGVCASETKKLNQLLAEEEGVEGIVVSKDLPFAMKRFCDIEGIKKVISASDFRYNDVGTKYNVEMVDGPLKSILARAVWVIDKEDTIIHSELVPEITEEPDYNKIMESIEKAR